MKVVQDFSGGKMNMDVDPRYMPKGQYREARNVRVVDTDNENSGVIESMDGTRVVVDDPLYTEGSKVIGMYEYDRKIYMFTALSQGGISILEHDSTTGESAHVLVDQLSTLKDVDGLKNTICFLHNKKDPGCIFDVALKEGFGWYVPSREEIKEVIDNMGSKWLVSEREEYIVDFNEKNIVAGQSLSSPTKRSKAVKSRATDSVPAVAYWTSTEIDDTTAYVYDVTRGLVAENKTVEHPLVIIRRFRYDVTPGVGDTYDGGVIYTIDKEKMEAKVFKQMGTSWYDSTPKSYYQSLVTPFNTSSEISGFAMINNIMVFHDWMGNDPVEIDITLSKGYYKYYDWTSMKLIKRPPMEVKVEVAEKSELGEMRNINPLFAARYIYDTKETSAISPYSNASSMADESTGFNVSYDMMIQAYVYNNSIMFRWSRVNKEDGDIIGHTDQSMSVPIGTNIGNVDVVSLKAAPYKPADNSFNVKGVCCLNVDSKKQFFIYFDTVDGTAKVVEEFTNFNDGGDINLNNNFALFGRTGGFSGSNNSGLWLQQYNPQDGSYGEIRGFESSGDMKQGMVCMSDTGRYCYIIYKNTFGRSEDNGKSWTELNVSDMYNISTIKPRGKNIICSSDGNVVYMSLNDNFETVEKWTLVSRDHGKTFSLAFNFPYTSSEKNNDPHNKYMACSSNGKYFVTVGYSLQNVYYSSDYGSNLTRSTVNGSQTNALWKATGITMSPSGRVVFISTRDINTKVIYVYRSNDFGRTFNRVSVLTAASTPGAGITFLKGQGYSNEILNEITNSTSSVDISVNTGNEHVKKIDILMKTGFGMYKIKTIDKDKEGLKDNQQFKYRFSYSGMYPLVPTKDVVKIYDNVPLKARSCMIIQNSLLFGGYMDGLDIESDISISAVIENVLPKNAKYSLKTGVTQNYGIIFYDEFGRCSPVLAETEAKSDRINVDVEKIGRVASLKVSGTAPSWAKKFKFARRNPNLYFDVVNGFDNAIVVNNRVYLEITSMPWIVPNAGDKIELVSEQEELADKVSSKGYIFEIKDKVVIEGNSGALRVQLSDGTIVSMDEDKNEVPSGRYIIIDSSPKEGYSDDDINGGDSRFTSSVFYIIMYKEDTDNIVFQEIPGIYDVPSNGYINDNFKLAEDGDVMLASSPAREINRFTNGTIFSTLGRPNSVSENYSQEDRFASMTVSEPYVEDTKDNGLSSFNSSMVNYTDLGKKYGEIVKIHEIGSDIDVYQRNKCSRVMYKKNILSTATGESIVAKSEDVFGEQQEYSEDVGMSDYKTFSVSGNSRFFVDTNTGQVLRKEVNGIFPISSYGMKNYFHEELMKRGVTCGGYDVKHSSYVLALKHCSVNFMEPIDGWTSFYDMVPEWMQRAGGSLYMAKDAIIRAQGEDHENQNYLQRNRVESKIVFVNNEYSDSNKVYNTMLLESNIEPSSIELKTHDSECTIYNMVWKEKLLEAYIPRVMTEPDIRMIYISNEDLTGDKLPYIFPNANIEVGETLFAGEAEIGKVTDISKDLVTLDNEVTVKAGVPVYVKRYTGINGEPMRGKYIQSSTRFEMTGDKLLLKSIQLDIDESKI